MPELIDSPRIIVFKGTDYFGQRTRSCSGRFRTGQPGLQNVDYAVNMIGHHDEYIFTARENIFERCIIHGKKYKQGHAYYSIASGGRVSSKGGKNPPLLQGDSSIFRTTLTHIFRKQRI